MPRRPWTKPFPNCESKLEDPARTRCTLNIARCNPCANRMVISNSPQGPLPLADAAVLAKLRGDACAAVQGAHGVPGCGECVECLQRRIRAAEGILRRAVIYATEDLMRTPGSTRLARALADAEKWLNP